MPLWRNTLWIFVNAASREQVPTLDTTWIVVVLGDSRRSDRKGGWSVHCFTLLVGWLSIETSRRGNKRQSVTRVLTLADARVHALMRVCYSSSTITSVRSPHVRLSLQTHTPPHSSKQRSVRHSDTGCASSRTYRDRTQQLHACAHAERANERHSCLLIFRLLNAVHQLISSLDFSSTAKLKQATPLVFSEPLCRPAHATTTYKLTMSLSAVPRG